jgi:DNA-binding transcriptional ArsR family regulator
MKNSGDTHQLLFPCECVSARTDNYSDPWAPVSRNRLFSDGTKEEIMNLVADRPMTISQIAKALKLSVPSIHKHVIELLDSELLRDSIEWEKLHPKERYYEPNFPVVKAAECQAMEQVFSDVTAAVVDLFEGARPRFEKAFEASGLSDKGWKFEDLSQCAFARIQRTARRKLEERGSVKPPQPHRNGVRWSFWAEQTASGDSSDANSGGETDL